MPVPQLGGPVAAPRMSARAAGFPIHAPLGPLIMGGLKSNMHCFVCGGAGHWPRNCPQAAVTSTLHQPHVKAKFSQGGALSAVRAQCNYFGVWPY